MLIDGIYKSQLIEVVIPGIPTTGNQQTTITFPDQPYLRNKRIFGIEVFTQNDMSVSPQQNTPISTDQLKSSYLSLYTNDLDRPNSEGLWLEQIPMTVLHRVENAEIDPFVRTTYVLMGQSISWEKCQIILPTAFGNTDNVSFLFNIYFREQPLPGVLQQLGL